MGNYEIVNSFRKYRAYDATNRWFGVCIFSPKKKAIMQLNILTASELESHCVSSKNTKAQPCSKL